MEQFLRLFTEFDQLSLFSQFLMIFSGILLLASIYLFIDGLQTRAQVLKILKEKNDKPTI